MSSTLLSARPVALGVRLHAWIEVDPLHQHVRACGELKPIVVERQAAYGETSHPVQMHILRLVLCLNRQERATDFGEPLMLPRTNPIECKTQLVTASHGMAHAFVWAEALDENGQVHQLRAQSGDVNLDEVMGQ